RAGRLEQARHTFEKMMTYANHLGLYAEEIGPSGEALGNFPQAFTHLGLIRARRASLPREGLGAGAGAPGHGPGRPARRDPARGRAVADVPPRAGARTGRAVPAPGPD